MKEQVIIIGAGVSGLTAARILKSKGISFKILDSKDCVGGKLQTDKQDGFLLDHGFQVILDSYPELNNFIDHKVLSLQHFHSGAQLLHNNGKKEIIADPLRSPSYFLSTLLSTSSSIADKFKLLKLTNNLKSKSIEEIFKGEQISTMKALKEKYKFSQKFIDEFFHPFFSGVFLDNELRTSKVKFDFLFKMFAEGHACVPLNGMNDFAQNLANSVPKENILLNTTVTKVEGKKVYLHGGEYFEADKILFATEASNFLEKHSSIKHHYLGTTQLYFKIDGVPIKHKFIMLPTSKNRLITNACILSNVSSNYAPKGQSLLSISINGKPIHKPKELIKLVKNELAIWFGKQVESWLCIAMKSIPFSLPDLSEVKHSNNKNFNLEFTDWYICGDHTLNGSLNAAMKSGREAGEQIALDL